MKIYKLPIEIALITFPFIALLFTLPFLIHEYRKYGSINILKSIIIYSFILYLLTAYFMIILPLPSFEEVANYTGPTMQLNPFQFIQDIDQTTIFNITDLNSLLIFLNESTVYTVLFNVLLTIPFGIYLKYLFHKKWYQVIIISFFLSLFFELTQLTGLYGIYPKPYRLFDVDDLIVNTFGGILGYVISPLIIVFLPSTDELNNKSLIRGQKVSLLRRLVSLFIDIIFLSIFSLLFKIILFDTNYSQYAFIIAIFLYYIVIPVFNNTKTIGKVLIKTEIKSLNNKYTYLKLIFRNLILSYLLLYPYSWVIILMNRVDHPTFIVIVLLIIFVQVLNIISYLIPIKKERLFLYERITGTKNNSTINIESTKDNNESSEKMEVNK